MSEVWVLERKRLWFWLPVAVFTTPEKADKARKEVINRADMKPYVYRVKMYELD